LKLRALEAVLEVVDVAVDWALDWVWARERRVERILAAVDP
jgi:hypothetical protein